MVGKFYSAPAPSDPPYVEVGSKVAAGATVGLIEVMKVFASIKAETAGVIERILVSSGEFVEFGQPLFLLRPNVIARRSSMEHVHFVDTTIRDGHQSLWAERMSTGMMLPIAKNLDEAGFRSDRAALAARTSRRPCANCARTRGSASSASARSVPIRRCG